MKKRCGKEPILTTPFVFGRVNASWLRDAPVAVIVVGARNALRF
jgi:hypothetical protein